MLNFNQDKLLAWDLEIFEGNEIDLFYFHDFPNRIGYFDVIVQSSELSGLAADGVEWNESTRVWKAGPAYSYFFIQ